jgi:hypothetical protein
VQIVRSYNIFIAVASAREVLKMFVLIRQQPKEWSPNVY